MDEIYGIMYTIWLMNEELKNYLTKACKH